MNAELVHVQNQFYCYIIASGNRTYNGYTNNLTRRLRQHNREIKGGARATGIRDAYTGEPWHYIAILTCVMWTAQRAMQVEWNIKYPTRHKPRERCFQGPQGRIQSFIEVFKFVKDSDMVLYVHADYMHLVDFTQINSLQIVNITTIIK
jgi:structure-specific endonuclease subunit SLX1